MKFYLPEEYQDLCRAQFQSYKRKVSLLLPNAVVEHIGSSAIPGAISKGDLDIYVGVEQSQFEQSVQTLTTLGFSEKQNTLRTSELCMLESKTDNVAFQVVANGSQHECFLRFRDYLVSNPELVRHYNKLKQSCEGYSHEDYRTLKSDFIEQVLDGSLKG
ncbi:GrpB family protein [Vibrio neptunius]|uniref:GrpB family protein n=1 Tax=Vibrio neptunius TaxID=170651 RepID=UPI001C5C86F9|nr:GrpB family protein [Vibrio neptunius]QXX08752.1 GrpB family protein [Vibrio neptunius]